MKRSMQISAIALLVLVFAASGLAKLAYAASFQEQFAHFGLPGWMIVVTAILEVTGAGLITLSIRGLRRFGAVMLAATMAVATALHLLHDPIALALPAAALMLLALYVASIPGKTQALRGQVVA